MAKRKEVTDTKKPTIVETKTKEVFDEFYYKGEALFKEIDKKHEQILKLQSDIAALITDYVDLVAIERRNRKVKIEAIKEK